LIRHPHVLSVGLHVLWGCHGNEVDCTLIAAAGEGVRAGNSMCLCRELSGARGGSAYVGGNALRGGHSVCIMTAGALNRGEQAVSTHPKFLYAQDRMLRMNLTAPSPLLATSTLKRGRSACMPSQT
jgi:hypothetical protein